ncbi:MAG: DUF3576 domain-containing protein [Alphaproteobacteria bacterium]|nr:DUF3576 domain-containing protein [Alphaproteobacteria bacterium]
MVGGQRFGHFRYFSGILLAASLGLSACENLRTEGPGEIGGTQSQARSRLTGEGGGTLLSLGGRNSGTPQGATLGVNSFLWRASLDTIAFMPLASADPFGGVIITDWYSPPESPDERFKATVYILGQQLRADAVRAQVFRQRRGGAVAAAPARGRPAPPRPADGPWTDVAVDQNVVTELENAILTRARQLRIDSGARS